MGIRERQKADQLKKCADTAAMCKQERLDAERAKREQIQEIKTNAAGEICKAKARTKEAAAKAAAEAKAAEEAKKLAEEEEKRTIDYITARAKADIMEVKQRCGCTCKKASKEVVETEKTIEKIVEVPKVETKVVTKEPEKVVVKEEKKVPVKVEVEKEEVPKIEII